MLTHVYAAAVLGVEAYLVTVEVHLTAGLPAFHVVGLPDGAVRESRLRLPAALDSAGYGFPRDALTINLAPADIRKDGTAFDLPMAIGILLGMHEGAINVAVDLSRTMILGELGLDGSISPIRGALPMAMLAHSLGFDGIILPQDNAAEAACVEGLNVYGASHLQAVFDHIIGRRALRPTHATALPTEVDAGAARVDFDEVAGQAFVKRALEVAAAGGHNVMMIGPPGAGKSMLARRLPTILPSMSFKESLETSAIYSITGQLRALGLIRQRPYRHPHHTISDVGLAGGGSGVPRPGEVSLAHHGVLFLDELPEFKAKALEVLRQPLEDGEVTISRSLMSVTFPANVMLVAAMNPCKCGYFETAQAKRCHCPASSVRAYRRKVSGPLLDRIDLHIEVPAVDYETLKSRPNAESSRVIQARVEAARARQCVRFEGEGIYTNAQMQPRHLYTHCVLDEAGHGILSAVVDRLGLSARAHHRILKVARTIADLEDAASIAPEHLAEAIQYRTLDRQQAAIAA